MIIRPNHSPTTCVDILTIEHAPKIDGKWQNQQKGNLNANFVLIKITKLNKSFYMLNVRAVC